MKADAGYQASRNALGVPEFVALMAILVSIVALATDIMLPALANISQALDVQGSNDIQLVVSMLFLGFVFGQLLAGPLSDRYGRRPAIHAGFAIFILGCVISALAQSLEVLLVGRTLQGLGAAAPRIVTLAIVRDSYVGRGMAQIMSIVMAVFILVPMVAPLLGQALLMVGSWRISFLALLIIGLVGWLWFAIRQPETLTQNNRHALSASTLATSLKTFFSNRAAVGYTLAMGWAFGAFVGYLSCAQQVFQQTYATGSHFALWFAVAALAIGLASLANSALVERFGMRALAGSAMLLMSVVSILFLSVVFATDGVPPFGAFMVWLSVCLACMGVMFGNLNALAMENLGGIAGLGAALNGSLSTLIALPLAWMIGHGYDGRVEALVAGFAVLGAVAFATAYITERALPWRVREVAHPQH